MGDINIAAAKEIDSRQAAQVQVVTYSGTRTDLQKEYTLEQVKVLDPETKKEVLKLQDAGFGSSRLAAPQAGLMAMLSRGIVEGRMPWALIVVGMLMGIGFVLMQVKSPMLVSVGMYLPLETTFAIFLGGCIKGIVEILGKKKGLSDAQKIRVENSGVLVAAGLIAGEALVGLIFAGLAAKNINYSIIKSPGMFFISLIILAIIALILIIVPMRDPGPADAPAPPKA
ncbi:MAG: OPT/YSL family transporter [Holophaga sp.]|nr:OPT/YSL family transporter [Holophaga sp.]